MYSLQAVPMPPAPPITTYTPPCRYTDGVIERPYLSTAGRRSGTSRWRNHDAPRQTSASPSGVRREAVQVGKPRWAQLTVQVGEADLPGRVLLGKAAHQPMQAGMGRVRHIVVMHSQSVVTDDAQAEGLLPYPSWSRALMVRNRWMTPWSWSLTRLSIARVFRSMTGRNPEEVIDDGTVRGRFQGTGHVVDIVSGTDGQALRLGVMLADGVDGRVIPPDDGDPIGRCGEGVAHRVTGAQLAPRRGTTMRCGRSPAGAREPGPYRPEPRTVRGQTGRWAG